MAFASQSTVGIVSTSPVSAKVATSPFQSFLAGSTSGAVSCLLFQPLDLIKTRLQLSQSYGTPTVKSLTIYSTAYNVVHKENFFALWKGLSPSLYRTVPGVGFYFCTLQSLKSFLKAEPTFYENLLLGFTARSVVGTAFLPVTVIKARFESGRYSYRTVSEALRIIWKLEGISGLYSGFTATIARDAPFSGLYLMFYSQEKKVASAVLSRELGSADHFACGVIAGLLASVVTHPADVTKTQMQLYPSKYPTTKHCVVAILKEHGVMGFFRGVLPRCLRRTLISAVSWTVFEELIRQWKR